MSAKPKLFKIDPPTHESKAMDEVDFRDLGFQERRDIQKWIAANPGILGEDLLIVGEEFSDFDKTNERLDLLAVDPDGKLVVIELKRDDTGADVHWQAIKYASYQRRTRIPRTNGEQRLDYSAGWKSGRIDSGNSTSMTIKESMVPISTCHVPSKCWTTLLPRFCQRHSHTL